MKRFIEVSKQPNFEVTCSNGKKYVLLPVEHLYDIPAADVVEVVRCRRCKFWEPDGGKGRCNGIRNGLTYDYTDADDYCSYGERE